MINLWSRITEYSLSQPHDDAIIGDKQRYSWTQLYDIVLIISQKLNPYQNKVLALYSDNSPEWVIIDLACRLANVTLLPLPLFFSEQQLKHAISNAGTHGIIHSSDDVISKLVELSQSFELGLGNLVLDDCIDIKPVALPIGTDKITFTSGSTGQPKGVCLNNEHQIRVAESLLQSSGQSESRHLSVLPFSTLLENIGGIYAPLLSGGTIIALSQSSLGFNGNSGLDISSFVTTISQTEPNSLILLPELLLALIGAIKQGWQAPTSLRFIAVGGSRVSTSLLEQAYNCGLPVYQGYGLSECCSVVALNTPELTKLDSVGQVLPHCSVSIVDNEIIVSDSSFLGYVDQPDSWYQQDLATGDIGKLDSDGFLFIEGRKKNLLISSFGRNINPEWVESELLSNGLLQQCVVYGDAQPFCIALIKPRDNSTSNDIIQSWIDHVNNTLPDYAKVKKWLRLDQALSGNQGTLTSNGRPIRATILKQYQDKIDSLYQGYA